MLTATVSDLILRARQRADMETTSEAQDFVTDAEVLTYFNEGYRRLIDLVLGANGADLIAITATLAAPTYAMPSDFYHPLSIEKPVGGRFRTLPLWNFHERNRAYPPSFPAWRVVNNLLKLMPPPSGSALGPLQLWYVPHAQTLIGSATFSSFGGWDDFIVLDMAIAMVMKEDRDTRELREERDSAEKRVKESVSSHLIATPETINVITSYPEDYFDAPYGWVDQDLI